MKPDGFALSSGGSLNAPGLTLRLLKRLTFAGELILLAWLVATEGLSGIALFAACILCAAALATAVLSKWPGGAVLTLIVASAMPRLSGTLFSLHVRPEHIAAAFVVMAVFAKALFTGFQRRPKIEIFDWLLLIYVILNFATSAFTSPQPSMTLRWALLNAIIISPYYLMRFLLTDRKSAANAMQALLWVGCAESIVGIYCYLSNFLFHTSFGITSDQYGAIPGLYGTQYEANLFGSYTGCCAIFFLAFFLMGQESRRARYAWGLAFSLVAAFLSLARSVLIALPVAAIFVVWAIYKSGRIEFRSMMRLAAIVGVLLLAVSPFLIGTIIERFSTLDPDQLSSDSSSLTRLVQNAVGFEDVRAHPILGTGTASFQLFFDWNDYMPGMGGDTDQGGWLSSTPLRILHDTGVVGLFVFISFAGSLAFATRKAYRTAEPKIRTVILALAGGLVLYAITFQATEATLLAFTWVHVGLLAGVVGTERQRIAQPEA